MASYGQNRTMTILLVFLGIVAGYLFYAQTLQDAQLDIPPLPIRAEDDLKRVSNITFDFSVFDSSVYNNLRVFGEIPVNPGITGRTDIFAPF